MHSEHASHRKTRKLPRAFRTLAIFVLLLGVTGAAVLYSLHAAADGKILAHVSIASVDVGGLTPDEARAKLESALASYALPLQAGSVSATIAPHDAAFATFRVEQAVSDAYSIGRTVTLTRSLSDLIAAARGLPRTVAVPVDIDQDRLKDAVHSALSGQFADPVDARLSIRIDAQGNARPIITDEQQGYTANFDELAYNARLRLANLDATPVAVNIMPVAPTVSASDLHTLDDRLRGVLALAPFIVTARGHSWNVSRQQLASWLTPIKNAGAMDLTLDADRLHRYLSLRAHDVYVAPKDAIYVEQDGVPVSITPSVDGVALDIDNSIQTLSAALLSPDAAKPAPAASLTIALPLMPVAPKVPTAASNPYGVSEIIGVGETSFRGSPKNRRTNIAVGASKLQGAVVAPGEEFSLVKRLLPIDEEHGYLKELVIKDNKTEPEFGGGLCQIGTTAFRAVLNSGLPITERQNHSYRVPYYERDGDGNTIGPGMDATIYDPAPDFKFVNDTGANILILTSIKKNRLTFTFWGKRDGRKAMTSPVTLYNETPPPEKKLVDSTDIPPGKIKCTETAHPGGDTVFTYNVTYADGTKKQKTFRSHYKPWGEVCLVGVEPAKMTVTAGAVAATTPTSADAAGATGN